MAVGAARRADHIGIRPRRRQWPGQPADASRGVRATETAAVSPMRRRALRRAMRFTT
jgi:hypothetical protein